MLLFSVEQPEGFYVEPEAKQIGRAGRVHELDEVGEGVMVSEDVCEGLGQSRGPAGGEGGGASGASPVLGRTRIH